MRPSQMKLAWGQTFVWAKIQVVNLHGKGRLSRLTRSFLHSAYFYKVKYLVTWWMLFYPRGVKRKAGETLYLARRGLWLENETIADSIQTIPFILTEIGTSLHEQRSGRATGLLKGHCKHGQLAWFHMFIRWFNAKRRFQRRIDEWRMTMEVKPYGSRK